MVGAPGATSDSGANKSEAHLEAHLAKHAESTLVTLGPWSIAHRRPRPKPLGSVGNSSKVKGKGSEIFNRSSTKPKQVSTQPKGPSNSGSRFSPLGPEKGSDIPPSNDNGFTFGEVPPRNGKNCNAKHLVGGKTGSEGNKNKGLKGSNSAPTPTGTSPPSSDRKQGGAKSKPPQPVQTSKMVVFNTPLTWKDPTNPEGGEGVQILARYQLGHNRYC